MSEREEKFERMLMNILRSNAATTERLQQLRTQELTRTVTYRELLTMKIIYQEMLAMYKQYGIID